MPDWSNHLLLVTVAAPAFVAFGLVGSGLIQGFLGLPPLPEVAWRVLGLVTVIATFLLAFFGIGLGFDPEAIGFQHVEYFGWSEDFGAHLLLGVDGIGLCFLVSTAGLVPLAMVSSRSEVKGSVRSWIATCLFLESGLLGALASANLFSFIFFWGMGLVPILLWMGRWGGPGRARAAGRIWAIESIGLMGLLYVAFLLREASLDQLGMATLDLVRASVDAGPSLLDVRIPPAEQTVLFFVMAIALATRLPLVPLHYWLPTAHAAAPTGLSVLLATGFVQTAAIGILRFALPLFPDAATSAGPALSVLGIVALVHASLIALVQKELKRLVAYTCVGYAGFAVFGISTLNVQGLSGAVLQLLTHGIATAALFMLIGFLAARRGTTEVTAFGGLAKPMPVCAFFFAVMAFSLVGLPLTGGFVGDLFVLLGSLETRRELSVLALTAMVVAASYLLWVQRRLFLGPVDEPANRGLIDLDRRERTILLAMAIPIIAIGVYPNPILRRVEPAVLEILDQMARRSTPVESEEPGGDLELVAQDSLRDIPLPKRGAR
ncbi:MAG TPA: NADH-quinone oxidoreductase subunit M [Deltaproteobacteria bacterium]|nr:NADH-quinone oxidoreductase subunit M [Deltaproteobacteria bacterium]